MCNDDLDFGLFVCVGKASGGEISLTMLCPHVNEMVGTRRDFWFGSSGTSNTGISPSLNRDVACETLILLHPVCVFVDTLHPKDQKIKVRIAV